jgi:hypothetical protein
VLAASDTRGTGAGASGGKSISSNGLVSNAPSNERIRSQMVGEKRKQQQQTQNKQNTPKAEPY